MTRHVNFDIDCLRSFLVVADTMSFSRTAEIVGRAQSTISQQIAKLEMQVGKELLMRRKGRVLELTGEGKRLAQYARRMLQLNDEAYSSMSDDVLSGSVRLGVPLDFFGRDIAIWLARFKQRHPMVALEVEANQSDNLMRRSERGEFDLAFFKQEAGASKGVVALTEQLVWVAGPNYVPAADESAPMILFPEGCAYRRFAIGALEERQRPWHISFVGPSFDCLKSALAGGLGISVLARTLVTPPLRIIQRDAGLPQLPVVELVYSFRKHSNSRVVTELADFINDRLLEGMSAPADA
ncbi:LysR family transcriptional regulator [Roseibium algicola]|uniref:LysR family transcriptional regulator n=1 Tax=Roseibium algicola TaxID=2857014 RepID=A0ABM6I132_9HYPH|nr:LysR substrate-binding domain-containing protein [Roseibium aggregatum]AQQ03890.1 LysR family transcriptional regulator [Roseibium aggregatum]